MKWMYREIKLHCKRVQNEVLNQNALFNQLDSLWAFHQIAISWLGMGINVVHTLWQGNLPSLQLPPPRGVLPSNRLMGMCPWMGAHFPGWIDYYGVVFLWESLEWGRKFSGFWGSENSGMKGFKNNKIYTTLSLTKMWQFISGWPS